MQSPAAHPDPLPAFSLQPTLEEADGRVIHTQPPSGVPERDVLVIIYPGGLVRPQAYEWLARALSAPRDPMWVSDGVASQRWTPVSPVSSEIVPCEWKAPFEMPEQLEADAPGALLAAPVEAKPLNAPPAALEAPKMVTPQRAPDDPGLPEDFDQPSPSTRRALPAEG